MPLINPQHIRLLRVLARSRQYLPNIHSKPSGVRGAGAGHNYTSSKPKELFSRDKTDAQQALLEEAAENAAQLLTAAQQQRRWRSAEAWTLRWDWASY
jgi:hypothetical protein